MRIATCFNENWAFLKQADRTSAAVSDWMPVNLPHTWNAVDGTDGGNDYHRGTCWYRKHFARPALEEGGEAWLEFAGAAMTAEVFLNGRKLARHEGGYSLFRVNITEALQDDNLLEVSVDNSISRSIYPQHADFTFYGGIYRDVNLICVPKEHFALDYYGGPGISVTPRLSPDLKSAEITVETWQTASVSDVTIEIDGQTKTVPAADGRACASFTLDPVHLWNGKEDPFLYTCTASLSSGDAVTVEFGCRTVSIDAEKGFYLNSRNVRLAGGARHQDREGKGNALSKADHEEDLSLMLEAGFTGVRLAHYQQDAYFYSLCDRSGLMAWAEIPYISEHMEEGRDNTVSQMKELIIQNYHHPAIVCWGLSNEITVSTGVTEGIVENHRILNDLCHRMDPSRPTVMAHAFMLDPKEEFSCLPDAVGWNLYYGWYIGDMEGTETFMDEWRSLHPDMPVGLTEFGADANPAYQSGKPQRGDYTEGYQCLYHEYMLDFWEKHPYLWIFSMWNTFDFGADGRNEIGKPGQNQKGLVTFDRKLKKDAFYLYKAYLSDEKFLHLCGSRYVDRTEDETDVTVYATVPEMSLYVDGQLLETKTGNRVFRFTVPISAEHVIEAKGGGFAESIRVRKVDKPNPSYIMDGMNTVNWFDDPTALLRPGYFSVMDTVADIKENPEAAAIYHSIIDPIMEAHEAAGVGIKAMIPENLQRIMDQTPWENQLKQMGKEFNADVIRQINSKLNQIPK